MTESQGPLVGMVGEKRTQDQRKELQRSGSPLFGKVPVLGDEYELPAPQNVHELGSGSYATVLTATKRGETAPPSPPTQVALKRILLPSLEPKHGKERLRAEGFALREVELLRKLDGHPNIIKLLDVRRDPQDNVYLVFDLIDNDLLGILSFAEASHLSARQIAGYMKDLFEALDFCHGLGIVHRDVKPENILVTREGVVKLADFGLAREMMADYHRYTNPVQTRYQRAPELLLGSRDYDNRIDVWAAVCVVLECVLRKPMLPGNSDEHQLQLIYELCGTPRIREWPAELVPAIQQSTAHLRGPLPSRIRARLDPEHVKWRRDLFTEELTQLAEAGLELNPRKRPSIKELLSKPWFQNAYPPELRFRFPPGQRGAKVRKEQEAKAHHQDKHKHAKK